MSVTWADVVAMATRLPRGEESTSYGTPAIKVAGTLMGRLRTDAEGLFALKCSPDDKVALVDGPDPAYSTSPHYDGYAYVLVDLERVDATELAELVEDAWRIAAPASVRRQLDG